MEDIHTQRIILFDGICNFCNHWVQFALKRDKKGSIRFATLQGETAKTLLPRFGIDPAALTSVIFIDGEKAYTQSSAALRICRYLNRGWPLLYGFMIIPPFLRNAVYNLIARNRYRWFGKKDSCMVPDAEIKDRFLP
jgi:predicted DCC family thiol-disulfide oxidoreductase YuxK